MDGGGRFVDEGEYMDDGGKLVDGGKMCVVRRRRDTMQRTRNSKELDAKTSNSTRRCRRRFNKQYTEKKMQQARTGCRMG